MAEDPRTLGSPFYAQCQELEDIAFGWVVDQILAAFAASLEDDLDLTEAQIESISNGKHSSLLKGRGGESFMRLGTSFIFGVWSGRWRMCLFGRRQHTRNFMHCS